MRRKGQRGRGSRTRIMGKGGVKNKKIKKMGEVKKNGKRKIWNVNKSKRVTETGKKLPDEDKCKIFAKYNKNHQAKPKQGEKKRKTTNGTSSCNNESRYLPECSGE